MLNVIFNPDEFTPQTPVVHWETVGSQGEGRWTSRQLRRGVDRRVPDEHARGRRESHEILVYVTDDAKRLAIEIFRSATVLLQRLLTLTAEISKFHPTSRPPYVMNN